MSANTCRNSYSWGRIPQDKETTDDYIRSYCFAHYLSPHQNTLTSSFWCISHQPVGTLYMGFIPSTDTDKVKMDRETDRLSIKPSCEANIQTAVVLILEGSCLSTCESGSEMRGKDCLWLLLSEPVCSYRGGFLVAHSFDFLFFFQIETGESVKFQVIKATLLWVGWE